MLLTKLSKSMLESLIGRQSGCQDLKSLIQHLNAANHKMAARAQNARKVGDTLLSLIQSEAPSFSIFFEKIQEIYTNLSINYDTASKEQSRAIEDLNDILIRTPIMQRISSERETAKKNYDLSDKRYREAKFKSQNEPSQASTALLRNLRIERAQFASILIEKTEAFLSYRTRFTKFVKLRSLSAWTRFGRSIERASKVESELMSQLSEHCKRLRDNLDTPHLILRTSDQLSTLNSQFVIE